MAGVIRMRGASLSPESLMEQVDLFRLEAARRLDGRRRTELGQFMTPVTILRALDLPRAQQNERSALTLLALLDMTPDKPWVAAADPLCGITPMMEFFAQHYGKQCKPNTRETVRRQTVHQFLDAGLLIANPDEPMRPINSPRAVYQIEPSALELFRTYGTPLWEQSLRAYLASAGTLRQRYAQERDMQRLPVTISSAKTISISPGGQNILIKQIIFEH